MRQLSYLGDLTLLKKHTGSPDNHMVEAIPAMVQDTLLTLGEHTGNIRKPWKITMFSG